MTNQSFKRTLSGNDLLLSSFAAIFGSGWLFAPLYAAQVAGPGSLLAWVLGAAMSMVIGLTIAEVVCIFPSTGGLSKVALLCFGEIPYFLSTLFTLLVCILLPVLEVRAVLQYLDSYFPVLLAKSGTVTGIGYLIGALLLVLVSGVNCFGAKVISKVTSLSVVFKLITPALLCVCFFFTLGLQHKLSLSRLTDFQSFSWSDVFLSLSTCGIIFSFNGFNQATLFASEAKDPQKSIPYAIIGSILLTGILYFIIQLAFLMAVPDQSLQSGWKNVAFSGDHGPFVGLSTLLGLGWLAGIIYLDAVISPLGTALAYGSAAPRMLFLLSEKVPFLAPLRKLSKTGIPVNALVLSLLIELVSLIFLSSLKSIIGIMVAAFVLCYSIAPASLLVLRQHFSRINRPFAVKYPKFLALLALIFSNWMVFSCGWTSIRNLICVSALPVLIALIGVRLEGLNLTVALKQSGWFLFQLTLLTLVSYGVNVNWYSFNAGLFILAGGSSIALIASTLLYSPDQYGPLIRAELTGIVS